MGDELCVWRARCGRFRSGKKLSVNINCNENESTNCKYSFEYGVIITILLIIGCVELNPGPVTALDLDTMRKQLQGEISTVKHQVGQQERHYKKVFDEMTKKIDSLIKENINLKQKVNVQDRQLRKNNIIIFGVPESSDYESCPETVQNICQNLNVNLYKEEIQDSFRLGRNKGSRSRPILCKLNSFNKKREILSKSKQCTDINVLNDLSKQDREDLKFLKPFAENARKKGQRAIIRGDKLIIEGHVIKKEQLTNDASLGNLASASQTFETTMRDSPTYAADLRNSPPTPTPPVNDITQSSPPPLWRSTRSRSTTLSPAYSTSVSVPLSRNQPAVTPPAPPDDDFFIPNLLEDVDEQEDFPWIDSHKKVKRQSQSNVVTTPNPPRGNLNRGRRSRGSGRGGSRADLFRGRFNSN